MELPKLVTSREQNLNHRGSNANRQKWRTPNPVEIYWFLWKKTECNGSFWSTSAPWHMIGISPSIYAFNKTAESAHFNKTAESVHFNTRELTWHGNEAGWYGNRYNRQTDRPADWLTLCVKLRVDLLIGMVLYSLESRDFLPFRKFKLPYRDFALQKILSFLISRLLYVGHHNLLLS